MEANQRPGKKGFIVFMTVLVLGANACAPMLGEGDNGDDRQTQGAVMREILSPASCVLSGVGFAVTGGIICTGGGASGTGRLTALSDSRDEHSIEITFRLDAGGSLEAIAGANKGATGGVIARGHGYLVSNTNAVGFGPTVTGVKPLGSPGTDLNVWCLEMHLNEADVHLIGDSARCPAGIKTPAQAEYESESDMGGTGLGNGTKQGSNWGFILSGATIAALRVNEDARFQE